MRIMLIHPRIFQGGAENLVVHLAYNLKQLGHEARIVTLYADLTNMPEVAEKVDFIIPNARLSKLCSRNKLACVFLALPLLYCLIKRHVNEFDVLNPHHGPAYWLTAFFYGKKPIIWNCSEPPMPVLWKFVKRVGYWDFLASKVANTRLEKFIVASKIDKIIVLDEKNQKHVRTRYKRASALLNAGVDFEFFRKGNSLEGNQESDFLLLTVGKLTPQKNQIVAIQVLRLILSKIPNARLIIIGKGPLGEYLKSEAKKLGVEDKIDFVGFVSDERLREFYHWAKVLLFPALNQSWGLTPFEALAAKTISIVSNDCGAAEIINRENIGLVAKPTSEEFARAILKIHSNEAYYRRMAEKGFDYVRNNMSWKRYAEKWVNVILEVLSTKWTVNRFDPGEVKKASIER